MALPLALGTKMANHDLKIIVNSGDEDCYGEGGNIQHLSDLIQQAMKHKGFSQIDIMQSCVSFNKVNTYEWYTQRIYELAGPVSDSFDEAIALARQGEDRIPIGILYRKEKPDFTSRIPVLKSGPLFSKPYDPVALQTVLDGDPKM